MTRQQYHDVAPADLASYEQQCAALAGDWQRLEHLLAAYRTPNADRDRLEGDYIALRSALSCDYPVLAYWRKGGYGLSGAIHRTIADAPTLGGLVESGESAAARWQAAWTALERVRADLREAHAALERGREPRLPAALLVRDTPVPFPLRALLKTAGITAAIVVLAGTLYFLRNFLGVWAPGAGEGLAVEAGMSDAQKIETVLATMNRAFQQNDVDLFMTVIADDFEDEDGNGRRALRAALQAYKETGEFGSVSMDWSRMRILPRDGLLDVRPVYIHAPDGPLSLHLGFKAYGDALLIATGSGT